jgi:aminopeptidase-like protein
MFKRVYGELGREVSGEIAFNHVAEISRHHRIQVSPGIREAVGYAATTLREYGLTVDVRKYKSDGNALAWSSPMFKEWNCKDAELRLIEPEGESRFLARFSENKMSIIQRSLPTPKGGVEAEVIILRNGEEEADYKGLDVRDKVVLTDGDVSRVRELAIERYGALGILYDGMWIREPNLKEGELDDAMKYTSFWWYGDEAPCWGFVLSPRTGRWLRRLIERSKIPVKVHAWVDSKLYAGEMENCVATIPGETKEMVIVVAHICHPQPSANDNARAERTPESCPSYVNSLLESIYDSVKAEAKNLGGSSTYALFKHVVTPFSGGSDHYVYDDPTVSVACPMMIQWPDKFYHTSADTIDKVDPKMLRKVALITATYAYSIADAGPQEALWIASETASREKRAILGRIQEVVTAASNGEADEASDSLMRLRDHIGYWVDRSAEAVRSVKRLAPRDKRLDSAISELVSNLHASAKSENHRAETTIKQLAETKRWALKLRKKRSTKLEKEATTMVLVRRYRGPISTRQWAWKMSLEDREAFYKFGKIHKEASGIETLAAYWSDGHRNLLEVSRLVGLESGRCDLVYLVGYFRFLEKMELVEFR